MSQHEYAFGRREGRRDKGRLLIIPRRLWGLWGALAGAVILVIFAVAAFAVMDRGPTAPSKLAEKNTAAPERTGARAIGASSRPKNDFRPPRSIAAAPPEPVVKPVPTPSAPPPDIRTVQAEAAPPVSPALPASSPIADRFPGPVASVKPARAVEPQPQIATPEEVTASVMERPELPRENNPSEDATWPVVPKKQARATAETADADAPTDCLPQALRTVLRELEARFGPVNIVSTTHLHSDNHSPGSIRDKLHQACKAVDIRANRDPREVVAFLKSRPEVGGINTYRNRLVHFDLDPTYRSPSAEQAEAGTGRRSRR